MGYKYATIPAERGAELGLSERRREVSGLLIINQDDLFAFGSEGESFDEKVESLGGEVITAMQAKKLMEII